MKWAEAALRGGDTPEAHHVLGKAYQAAGRPDSALPELRRAFEGAPAQRDFCRTLGRPFSSTGTSRRPWLYSEKGHRQFPKNPEIALAYGVSLLRSAPARG